jgi:enediyne biosynthesis protein E4
MSKSDSNDEPSELVDDTIVGKAVRMSLVAVGVAVFLGGIVMTMNRKPPEKIQQAEQQSPMPELREMPSVAIPYMPFTDVTTAAGIDFVHTNGAAGEKLLPETMGGGGAFFDLDGDGDQDILCVNSCDWPWTADGDRAATPGLFANDGTGQFSNITAGSGLDVTLFGNGVACGDYDNDGRVDVFISAVGQNRLFHNDGDGKFTDVTESAGLTSDKETWSTSCGFLDYDVDGDLDLFVCNYIDWSREDDLAMEFTLDGQLRAYGRPTDFTGVWPQLFQNNDGVFDDISADIGLNVVEPNSGSPLAKSLGVTFCDLNQDHRPDVLVANDTVQNLLFLSQSDGTYKENGAQAGVAFDNAGSARGAMGIDVACFRNTAAHGFVIGNFSNEMTALYVCQTPGLPMPVFRDEAVSNGIGPVTRVELTFGVLFVDVDLDGRLDLLGSNGHLEEDIQKVQASQHYEQPPQLLWNCGAEYDSEFLVAQIENTGADFQKPMVGRGATTADIDGDGDLDLLLFASGGRPRLLRNDQNTGNHWLRFKLHGKTVNRDALGAVVFVTLPDNTVLTRQVIATRSYQSQTELPVTFGLGEFKSVRHVTVRWPGGDTQEVTVDRVDQLIEVTQHTH